VARSVDQFVQRFNLLPISPAISAEAASILETAFEEMSHLLVERLLETNERASDLSTLAEDLQLNRSLLLQVARWLESCGVLELAPATHCRDRQLDWTLRLHI
jgi:hypothetical protein